MRRILQLANTALQSRSAGWLLLVVLAWVYLVTCGLHDLFPGWGPDATARGWWTWHDQRSYLREAEAIATGTLDTINFSYPIGYPAIGAILWRWWPVHPFVLPDLLLVLAAAASSWHIARRWFSPLETTLLATGFIASHATLLGVTMIVPWNTLPTQAALLAGVALTLAEGGAGRVLMLAGLAAGTYLVRSGDALSFGPMLVYATLALPTWRERIRAGLGGIAIVAAGVIAAGLLHIAVFGRWRSTYEMASVQMAGFLCYPPAYKVYWLLVDARTFFGEWEPAMLWRYTWLLLAVPGAVYCVQRERWAGAAVVAAVALSWTLYFNYNDFIPPNTYRFTLIHYLTWSFPLLILWSWAALRHGWSSGAVRAGFAVAAGLLVFAGGIRLDERPLATVAASAGGWRIPAQRPLVVRFHGVKPERAEYLRVDGHELHGPIKFIRPAVPADDLRIILSQDAAGTWLDFSDGAEQQPIELAEFEWDWRFSPARFRRIGR